MMKILLLLLLFSSAYASQTQFVVIIPSYNNEEYVRGNLTSLKRQTYPHWKAIYIDDASTDYTGLVVDFLVQELDLLDKVKVVHNPENLGSMANCYHWIHQVGPKKVIVHLDGDDRLAHPRVLERLAEVYNDKKVWLTYGNFISEPDSFLFRSEALPGEVIEKNEFRRYHWVTSHLKTYYAKLFHLVDKEYFLYKGEFVPVAQDQAIMLSLLELASKGHIRFIDEPLYIYNYTNPINDEKKTKNPSQEVVNWIRKKRPLTPLNKLF